MSRMRALLLLSTSALLSACDAARKLQILKAGLTASRPWPEALQALTGQRALDASAIADYFAPLKQWLDQQNRGRKCGW